MVRSSPAGIRFLFVMALVCAALTTLNTYVITIQQLYYEFSIRLNAQGFWAYASLEILAKWKNIRAVSLVLLIAAFVGSLFMPERYVFAFGVMSLSSFVFAVPMLINELPTIRARNPAAAETAWARRAHFALWIAISLSMTFLLGARLLLGSITEHLYVIPAAAAAASLVGSSIVLLPRTQDGSKKVGA
jgi:hypothetical protein